MESLKEMLYNLVATGVDSDEVARIVSEGLNDAQKRYNEEQEAKRKAEEEAAIAEAEKTALLDQKREHIADILGLYAAYLDKFHPTLGEQIKDEELNAMVDPIIAMIDRMAALGKVFGNNLEVKFQFDNPKEAEQARKAFNPFDFSHFWWHF